MWRKTINGKAICGERIANFQRSSINLTVQSWTYKIEIFNASSDVHIIKQ